MPQSELLAERFVLTARTELTDRILIFGERHLRTVLAGTAPTPTAADHTEHSSFVRHAPIIPPRLDHPRIRGRSVLGGLISEYERAV
jgi:putative transposase